ncbi:LPP20 family lipoprotein [Desulfobacula toluolica]|uniref:Lipoprotein LPP20-like domain-containing protein n=1 Tax=Desulfobacula toluolica (strain DSM 7467 / Tol2) TaxID=651182 RepID=K0NF22_DESTT|nr:LPP20 family lipoprotein [Desulfobacula toluolica]CCK78238.1 uncharacterized protein TOL2_C00680 [Desulfobacula toluolica Tol2]
MKGQRILVILISLSFLCSCAPYYPANMAEIDGRSVIQESDAGGGNERIVVFKVTGKGLAPESAVRIGEAEILGERSAILDGYRQLSEKLKGTLINSYSSRNGTDINMDKITAQTQSYLKGVEIMDVASNGHGVYTANMQVRVFFIYDKLIWWPSGLGKNIIPSYANTNHIRSYYATPYYGHIVRCESYPWCGESYYYSPYNVNR